MTMCDRPLVTMVNMGDIYNNVILHARINILWPFGHRRVAHGGPVCIELDIDEGSPAAVFCHNFLKRNSLK